jgi:prepilin-type N-terminal cleavage/methylation domain-containing protein
MSMPDRGFTLVEVLVAMLVLCASALGGIQLVAVATEAMGRARAESLAASLAASRMEQLRGLRFEFDDTGLPVTDTTTGLATDPPGPGGAGLSPSGASLTTNVNGLADFLGGAGEWVGSGTAVPPGAAFVRRWSIEAADAGGDLLVLQVLVRPVAAGSPGAQRARGEARYVSLLARTRR